MALGWGLWAEASAISGNLADVDRVRLESTGAALSTQDGLALFDRALASGHAQILPTRLNLGTATDTPLLRGLLRTPTRRVATNTGTDRLAGMSAAERERTLTTLVQAEIAAVLGHSGAGREPRHPVVQGTGLRLAHRRRAAQPAERRHRAAPATHRDLQLPDPA